MSPGQHSNTSTISPDIPRRVPTFTLQICKSTDLLSWWCNHWMTIWLGLQLTLVLPCTTSSIQKFRILLTQFSFTNTLCHNIHSNVAKSYGQMPFLTPTQYGKREQHFYWDNISRWLSDSPWDGEYTRQSSNWYFKNSLECNSRNFPQPPQKKFS